MESILRCFKRFGSVWSILYLRLWRDILSTNMAKNLYYGGNRHFWLFSWVYWRFVSWVLLSEMFPNPVRRERMAGRLYGMSDIMMVLYIDPDRTHILLEKCIFFITAYSEELKKQGANGVVMVEPASGLLSAAACTAFSSFLPIVIFRLIPW